ncbi:hypothetical protein BURMUCF1_0574 [Burkholderia multivorans ATCC BAA-247]|nr:hypothetical protein BURMUCF1_0574 [Burkholderia multivorans ATCC BAA-247]
MSIFPESVRSSSNRSKRTRAECSLDWHFPSLYTLSPAY